MQNDKLARALKIGLAFAIVAFVAAVFFFPKTGAAACCFYDNCDSSTCNDPADCVGYTGDAAYCLYIATPCTPYDTCDNPLAGGCIDTNVPAQCITGHDHD